MHVVNVSLTSNTEETSALLFGQYLTFDMNMYLVLTVLYDVFGDYYFKIDNKIKFNSKLLVYGIPVRFTVREVSLDSPAALGNISPTVHIHVSPTVHIHDPSGLEMYKFF